MELTTLDRLEAIAAIVDQQGRLVDWTRAFVEACARATDKLRGRPMWELTEPSDMDRLRAVLEGVVADGVRRQVETAVVDSAGTSRTITWSCVRRPHHDDQLIVLGVDISTMVAARASALDDRRRTAEALVARERELSAIYAHVPGIVFYVVLDADDEFRFASINQAFLDATGLRREDVVGHLVRAVIPPPSRDLVLNNYRQAFRTRQTVRWEEVSVYPAGERVGVVAVTPLFDATGAPTGLIGIVHDVTERKLAENALREADLRKNEFLAVLSHELRNPLTPIRNSLALVEMEEGLSERSRGALAVLDRQVTHVVRLVNDLLDVTRITQSRIDLRCQVLDCAAHLQRALDDHRESFDANGIALSVIVPESPVFVNVDPTRFVQVVGNVIGNALKFTPRGGRVEVMLRREGAVVVLRVRDNGVGIDRDVLAELFVPFAQARQPLDRSAGGLGLGLALVKRLVELHGGSVTVASGGPGAGTDLTVTLPAVEGPAFLAAELQVRHVLARRVLVIEDNVDAAETIQELLRSCGHQVQVAHDGPSGLAAADAFDPEVVFCDLGLPKMNGYEVCRALRTHGRRRLIIAALSGYARPCDLEEASAAGFDAHIAKPPTTLDLQRAVELATGKR